MLCTHPFRTHPPFSHSPLIGPTGKSFGWKDVKRQFFCTPPPAGGCENKRWVRNQKVGARHPKGPPWIRLCLWGTIWSGITVIKSYDLYICAVLLAPYHITFSRRGGGLKSLKKSRHFASHYIELPPIYKLLYHFCVSEGRMENQAFVQRILSICYGYINRSM